MTPIENAVSPSPWMDVSGSYGSSGKSGLTVLTHPSTDRVPAALDPARKGQHAERRLPGPSTVALPRDRPVILRYRIVLHRGELTPAEIARLQAEYAAEAIAQ